MSSYDMFVVTEIKGHFRINSSPSTKQLHKHKQKSQGSFVTSLAGLDIEHGFYGFHICHRKKQILDSS